jgi:hypothetical protein
MFSSSPILQNAIFALSAIYILDYRPTEELRLWANRYYKATVLQLSQALNSGLNGRTIPGQGDDIIAALATLNMIDVRDRDQFETRCSPC